MLSQGAKKIGCGGDLAVTSVTPLISRVDSADLAPSELSPSPSSFPRCSMHTPHPKNIQIRKKKISKYYLYPCFIGEKTNVQRTCLRPHGW